MAPKPKPKPSKPPPVPTPTRPEPETEPHEPICEFTHPCTTSTTTSNPSNANTSSVPSGKANASGGNPRKLISHIFGRNKTSTKLFPAHVWVHYCRKHYQRARYRSRAWPFTQCELLLDSLERMEDWGGVESFEVVLRRREKERLSVSGSSTDKGKGEGEEGVRLRKGTRRATSTSTSACASGDGDDEYADEEDAQEEESSDDGAGKRRRRRPRIKTCPVPEWLRAETGPGKSFDEIRDIVKRIREDLTEQHRRCQTQTKTKGKKEQVLFPDIEILPTFREWVLEQANEAAEGTRKMSRVSRKGAVQKVQR